MKKTAKARRAPSVVASTSRLPPARMQELLNVAAEVFAERGFEGASVGEMAKRANASKGTYYSRFPTKEALLMAVMGQETDSLEAGLADLMRPELQLEEALTQFAERILAVVLSDQMLSSYRVVTLEAQRFPELGTAFYANGAGKIANFLAGYLVLKARDGLLEISEPQITAEQFIDSLVGMPRLRAALGIGKLSKEEIAQRIQVAVLAFLRAYSRH